MQNLNKKIAIIIPAFNEELTIADVIMEFHKHLPSAEIYAINNNSKDRTASIADQQLKKLGCKGGVINEYKQGKGNAVRRAFVDIDADIYLMVDADMTYPASQASELLGPIIRNEADMVVGDRLTSGAYQNENKRSFHQFGNQLVKFLINSFFDASIRDVMSGYRAFNKKFVKNYPILVGGFEIETDLTLHAIDKRFRVKEIDIVYVDRPPGSESKLNTFQDGYKVIITIVKIIKCYKPFKFFGLIALIFFITALISAIPVFNDWISHQFIYHVPLAILSMGLMLTSLITFSLALMLDAIVFQEKMNYEHQLLNWKSD
jgi:glycosyltransferase involved in cell wall biosynthesis